MIIKNAWICQISDSSINPVYGDLIFSNGKIDEIIQKKLNSTDQSRGSEEEINAEGRVVTIPNINFHDHFYSRLAKGLPITGAMDNFHNILKNLWWKLDLNLDEDMILASAQMAFLITILHRKQQMEV
jgi:cytosine/adenosine deaminase-related metal-dependent hydrolase